ncbi:hypothetical protein F5Y11DRAFT_347416 [Daldinia sp. FL1419]|nr:hypothetical protein F5Y11DRAFT_347416 [Daldinia sp. FL1419]
MDNSIGFPRDPKAAGSSYDLAPQNPSSSSQEPWYASSQPYDYRALGSEYGGIPHRRDQDFIDGNQRYLSSLIRRNHESSRFIGEPSPGTPSASSEGRRGRKKVSRNTHRDLDVVESDIVPGYARRTGSRAVSTTSRTKEVSDEGRYRASYNDRRQIPVPPKAPKIPRLPTPDFDDMEHSKYDMLDHQFCACCGNDGGFGAEPSQGECTTAKMERQVCEARAYISHKGSHAR